MQYRSRWLCVLGLAALGAGAKSAPFFDQWQGKSAPPYVAGSAPPASSGAAVSVQVSSSTPGAVISPFLLGNNGAVWDGDLLLNSATSTALKRNGTRLLRFPGGSTSDQYEWDGNYASFRKAYPNESDPSVMNQAWAVNTDEFIAMCRTVGAEPMLTINFGLARYGTPAEAADLAARWVKYCNVDHNYHVRYWEIGNENYGDWERGTISPKDGSRLTGAQYGAIFNQIAAAMKLKDPSIAIGAVGVGDDNGDSYTGYYNWMAGVLPAVQDTADFLIVHNYFQWVGDGSPGYADPQVLLNNVSQVKQYKGNLDAMLTKYTHKQPGSVPYAMTEFNCENPNKHDMVELTDGLFVASALGELANAGYAESSVWDVYNGWDSGLGGDYGMLSRGAPGLPDSTPRPDYYAYALWSRFGDALAAATTNDAALKAYASTYAGGGQGVLLVNTTTSPRTVTLNLGGARRAPNANLWQLTGDAYTSKQVRWNGVAGPSAGGGPQDADAEPPYSVAVGASGPATVGIPALSASLIVIQPGTLYGDVDGNGLVDIADATVALRAAAYLDFLSAAQQTAADVNGDGTVDAADAALILARAGGLATAFPVE